MPRDNFSKPTVEVLAKRVGYHCSNPNCRRLTVGANEIEDKSTSIGEAAHITAAAAQGPRFDPKLTEDERKYIDNAIWLCSNCATLIDKDKEKYTVDVLREWKRAAEEESRRKLNGEIVQQSTGVPFLEVDLIWSTTGRSNTGYSDKNPIEIHDGRPVRVLADKPIIHWKIFWSFKFVIYNNSRYPAYNIKIESIGTEHFKELTSLPKVNNIAPLDNVDLKARFEDYVEGDYLEAEKIMKSQMPRKFKDVNLIMTYLDEMRNLHTNDISFTDIEIITKKV